jgi:hypothetical protein
MTSGYSLMIGKEVLFGGAVPPIPDNPETPEDEHTSHRFSFAPHVHKEYYTDASGNDAVYYVLGFAVGSMNDE